MSLLNMSFSASVLILVIVITRALLLHKLPKRTFLVLWGVVLCRLLVPFDISSRFSIYSIVNMLTSRFSKTDFSINGLPAVQNNTAITEITATLPEATYVNVSPFTIIWFIGLVVCALFIFVTHLRCRREYKTALPVDNEVVRLWQQEHCVRRVVQIRQSDRIYAPLTYGIFRPVVLLPKQTDWTDKTRLQYILTHEFVHIRRFDTLTKLVMVTALCIHWFNPFVWLMYVLTNRDIELSCDEAVVRSFGGNIKSAYALTLIGLEEKKNRFTPLVNNLSKNAIEERVQSIMRYKKAPILTIFMSAILVVGSITTFITSAEASEHRQLNQEKSKAVVSNSYQSFVFENVEVSYYDDGLPYLHAINTNNTDKTIIEIQYVMLGYDKYGNPLKLQWNFLDSSSKPTYEYIVKSELEILPQQTYDTVGGWSLYDSEKMDWPEIDGAGPNKVAYALYQIKRITFKDGSVWNNEEYTNWLETYRSKAIEVSALRNYYPNEIKITQ
ncbi:MAG: M56 family metallopeptidase [Clostridiales bacterium]|nr:M56 family metallopeptidase [Clostridiales bacterium]